MNKAPEPACQFQLPDLLELVMSVDLLRIAACSQSESPPESFCPRHGELCTQHLDSLIYQLCFVEAKSSISCEATVVCSNTPALVIYIAKMLPSTAA